MITVGEIKKQLAEGSTIRQVTENALKKAKAAQPKLNAFITICEDEALKRADVLDQEKQAGKKQGPLAGVPIAVKDILCTKGVRTTAGSKILDQFVPCYSATVVEKLEAAGAVIIGKTNLDEFAMGASNENSAYGAAFNPWDLTRVPGGSSGGSAAAVAAGIVPLAIGTDTGGSIREPASFCGIVGLKPTYGRVSRFGVIAFASSLDQVGPMASTVEDTALLMEVIAGKDVRDSTSAAVDVPHFSGTRQSLKGLRVGLPKEFFVEGLDPAVEKSVRQAVEVLKAHGAQVVDVELPHTKYGIAVYYLIAPCEASSNLARYDGVRFGLRAEGIQDLVGMYCKTRGQGFGPEPKRRIMLGTYALSSGYYDAYYLKACQVRRLVREDFLNAFQKCDLIAGAVTPEPAFKVGEKSNDPLKMYLNDAFTLTGSLAGVPGLSVNAGFSSAGLPIGVQLLAPHFQEARLLDAAAVIEKDLGLGTRRPHGF